MISIVAKFQNGFEGQNHTHIYHTFNQGKHELCDIYHLLQSCFSFFLHLLGQPEPFGSCIILQSCSSFFFSISTANLSCLLATTFSSLRFLYNSLSSPRFNLLRVVRCCFLWFSVVLFSRLSSAFLSSVFSL